LPRVSPLHVRDPAGLPGRLKAARSEAGLSQAELAFPGCSAAYISRIESGERVPSLQVLRELAHRLGVSEAYLTGEVGTSDVATKLVDAEISLRLGQIEDAEALYREVVALSENGTARAEALEGLGCAVLQLGRTREAIALLEAALGDGTPSSRPRLAESLGRAYATIGELAPAIAIFRECAERFGHDRDVLQYIRFAALLSYALTDAGEFSEAERVVGEALDGGRTIADPYARARLYWSQSRLLLEQGRSALAEPYAQKTLETLRVTGDTYAVGHAQQVLAEICLDLGRVEDAACALEEADAIISNAGTPIEIAHLRIDQARVEAARGDGERAARLALDAVEDLRDALPLDRGRAYLLVSEILARSGDSERALELGQQAVEVLEQGGPSRYLIEAYRHAAELLRTQGDTDEALDMLERAVGAQERARRSLA
jgi:tetratricopeptide (TPR) repeat protein